MCGSACLPGVARSTTSTQGFDRICRWRKRGGGHSFTSSRHWLVSWTSVNLSMWRSCVTACAPSINGSDKHRIMGGRLGH